MILFWPRRRLLSWAAYFIRQYPVAYVEAETHV
jgi:hypothetical protein